MSSFDLILKNGTVFTPEATEITDIAVKDGKIVDFGSFDDAEAIIDCTNLFVCPGLIDTQCHFREPGGEHKETLENDHVHHYAVVHRNGKSTEHYIHPIGKLEGPNPFRQKFTPKKITHNDLDHGTQYKHGHANPEHGKQSHNFHGQDREVKHIVAKDHNKTTKGF